MNLSKKHLNLMVDKITSSFPKLFEEEDFEH
jgi:hypothetical protein